MWEVDQLAVSNITLTVKVQNITTTCCIAIVNVTVAPLLLFAAVILVFITSFIGGAYRSDMSTIER